MPAGDGTGPMGLGPMTGRAAGYCAGYPVPGYMNPIPGRGIGFGFGWGRGRGRGWRHGYYATGLPGWSRWGMWPGYGVAPFPVPTPAQESKTLKDQATHIEQALNEIRQRISELDTTQAQES